MKYKMVRGEYGLFRVVALKDIPEIYVDKGQVGGLIENPYNLSQKGISWVHPNAIVVGSARVQESAQVFGCAFVSGYSIITNKARVYQNAQVLDTSMISGEAKICGNTTVRGLSIISGTSEHTGDEYLHNHNPIFKSESQ